MANESFRLLYPAGYHPPERCALPDTEFIHTLQLDQMIGIRRESYRGIADLQLEQFFSCEPAVLAYRAELILEIADSEALQALIRDALPLIRDAYEMSKVLNRGDGSLESGLASTRYIEQYLELVELFRSRLASLAVTSAGLRRLKEEIQTRCDSPDYRALRAHLEELDMQIGQVKSVSLGLNLDGSLHVTEAGLLGLHTHPFRQGSILDKLLGHKQDPMVCMSGFASVSKAGRSEERQALNGAVCRALDTVFAKTIRSWEPVINQFFHDETRFFIELMDDLRFLAAAVPFVCQLRRAGCPVCRPVIRPVQDKALRLHNLYNPMLALKKLHDPIVCNDFCLDEKGRFYLVTGPNHGGKSIFCYAVGMAQALFQLGLPVPAEEAEMSPVTGIYTHFPTSDEDNYGKGRLESECARISAILPRLRDTDLLLMDESFSSTSLLEGGYIAAEVLAAISQIGCGGLYVTHIHELSQRVAELSIGPGKLDNLVAQMQDVGNGTRSYRILRTTPDGLSYARDIARKYGLSREEILERRRAQDEA